MKNLMSILFLAMLVSTSCKGKTDHINTVDTVETAWVNDTPKPPVQPATIQMALLLDTSNSMDGLIHQAKSQLWEIVTQMSYAHCNEVQAQLEIGLYEYGNSRLSQQSGYIRQVLPFTTDLDLLSKELFDLSTKGGNEYCGMVIKNALDHLEWRDGKQDLKMIFIAGNESFLQGPVAAQEIMNKAHEKDIVVNTIYCGDFQTGISLRWKNAAQQGHGEYAVIDHNLQQHYVATPYDQKIIDLNAQLNKTYVAYGKKAVQSRALQSIMDQQNAGLSIQSNVKRSVAKSTKAYKNASWDLIDAAEDEAQLEKMIVANKESLDKDLKDKTVAEIKAITLAKKQERKKIQKQIQDLNTQRDHFLKNNSDAIDDSLESVLIEAIKKQAANKKYSWVK